MTISNNPGFRLGVVCFSWPVPPFFFPPHFPTVQVRFAYEATGAPFNRSFCPFPSRGGRLRASNCMSELLGANTLVFRPETGGAFTLFALKCRGSMPTLSVGSDFSRPLLIASKRHFPFSVPLPATSFSMIRVPFFEVRKVLPPLLCTGGEGHPLQRTWLEVGNGRPLAPRAEIIYTEILFPTSLGKADGQFTDNR